MGRPKKEHTTALTKYGKKIIALYITPEFEEQITRRAKSKNLTRQAYLITLINADLDAEKEAQKNATTH